MQQILKFYLDIECDEGFGTSKTLDMENSKKTNKCLGTLAYKDSLWTNQRYTGQTTPFNKRRWEGQMTAEMGNV